MKNKLVCLMLFKLLLSQNPYNLDTCEASISSDVPTFFQKYFHCVDIKLSESGNFINLYYNGLAPYDSWYYLESDMNYIPWESQGEGSFLIQNAYITEVDYVISIPVNPVPRSSHDPDFEICGEDEGCPDEVDGEVTVSGVTHEYPMGSVGAALNGVSIFNPCASSPDIIEDEAASFDLHSGHPAGSSGIYHYHTTSTGPLEVLIHKGLISEGNATPGDGEIEVYGIMCDGTVILGCTELDGAPVMDGEFSLDAQNGHSHNMNDENGDSIFIDRYHTHICYDEVTEEDTDGNGFQEHEFTPEISYYETPGMGESFDRCAAMSSPIEPDMETELSNNYNTIPSSSRIENIYPNPFNPSTTINFSIDKSYKVILEVYSLNGKHIDTLLKENINPGSHSILWDAKDINSGIYLVKLIAGDLVHTQKVVLVK